MPLRFFSLDGRLAACAGMLTGKVMADIGTDHGYLPIWAVWNGIVPAAVAADIRPGPLEAARRNVERYGLQDKIKLRLSDGLADISPCEADDVVIAGMGGELIARIVGAAPWLRQEEKTLILQPMTKEETLRRFLQQEGFTVEREQAALAGGKVYTVMQAVYTGVSKNQDPLFPVIGLIRGENEAQRQYLFKKVRALRQKQLAQSVQQTETIRLIEQLTGGPHDNHR